MTCAVCLRCGALKFGAWTVCPECFYQPEDEARRAKHLLVSDHYLAHRRLEEISQAVKKGALVVFPAGALTRQIFTWTALKAFFTTLALTPLFVPVHLYLMDLFQIRQSQVVLTDAGMVCVAVLGVAAAIPVVRASRRLRRDLHRDSNARTPGFGAVALGSSGRGGGSDSGSDRAAERGA
jgi:hypothetical protein